MVQSFEYTPSPREFAEQTSVKFDEVLRESVGIVHGEDSGIDPTDAFPAPAPVRAESDKVSLPDDQKAALADKIGELGFGRAENITPSEQGYAGAVAIVEGGQATKMFAELAMLSGDEAAFPSMVIMTASPFRRITGTDEIRATQDLLGTVGETEYNVAQDVISSFKGKTRGFVPYHIPQVLRAAYDVNNGNAFSEEPSGQFVTIGELNGVPVVMMQINRVVHADGTYTQPTNADVFTIVDQVLNARGNADMPIVQLTSHAYPSRLLGAAIAGLSIGRRVGVAAYGTDLMNQIKGTPGALPPYDQLPHELHVMAEQAARLRGMLANRADGSA